MSSTTKTVNTVTLGTTPKTFAPVTVEAPLPSGDTGRVQVTYTYRTRSEFGAFVDAFFAAPAAAKAAVAQPEAAAEPAGDEPAAPLFTAAGHLQDGTQSQADYLAQCVAAWDLDDPLTPANLLRLCDQFPAIAAEMRERYRLLVTEGRVGN